MRMVEEGMGEQFTADREALDAERGLDRAEYGAGLDNYYGAQGDQRRATYDARSAERQEHYNYGRETRGYTHDRNMQDDRQGFESSEAGKQRSWQSSEAKLDRENAMAITDKTIQGRIQTSRERYGDYLSTPQGSRMFERVSQTVAMSDELVQAMNDFEQLNEKQGTGGPLLNLPGVGSAQVWLDGDLQQMEQITNKIAPMLRQAGSGAMSDRDVEMFKKSIPNVRNGRDANRGAAERVRKAAQRISDFEVSRMEAAAQGRQAEFMREWSIFKSRVSIDTGMSFEEWRSTLPRVGGGK
jgi:hypothetical protein